MSGAVDDPKSGESVRDLLVQSWWFTVLVSVSDAVERTVDNAWLTQAGRTLAHWTRHSWLYDWLTAEPDPEVIVIDLRETYTVGPIIAALDWLAARIGPRWRRSRWRRALIAAEERIEPAIEAVAESRVGALLHALFVPPEPEQRDEKD